MLINRFREQILDWSRTLCFSHQPSTEKNKIKTPHASFSYKSL